MSYFFDYDVTMMLKSMPEERAKRLLNRHLRFAKDNNFASGVDIGPFQVEYIPHKEFKVRKVIGVNYEDNRTPIYSPWTIVSDVGQFFQTSFLQTLEKWEIGTAEEREMIRKGKSMRAGFAGMDDEIRAYNSLECLLLRDLMYAFRTTCMETGYVPSKWQGPGHLATAMLKKHGIPKRDSVPILSNFQFKDLANAAYYGGRFETTAVGPVNRPVWQYDINSAYPDVLRTLPCLIHGSWRRVKERPNEGLWFGRTYFYHPPIGYLSQLPIRDKTGNIKYPREGHGVYWSTELEAAESAGTDIRVTESWVYEEHCQCRWFDFIDDYYERRLRLGKTTKGYVLKLGGNSIYGKIAQSIGYAPFANPVWAGLITAGCRAKIIKAYSQAPDDCYMIATDGIFMGKQLDLPVSNKLGEWEETYHEGGMFIVQPGIYFLSSGDVKTRGVERGRIHKMRSEFEQQWQKYVDSHGTDFTISVPVDNFITATQALARRKWNTAGTWEHTTRELSFYWGLKRAPKIAEWQEGNLLRTRPHLGGITMVSVPYGRVIGGNLKLAYEEKYVDFSLAEAARQAEQPDWNEPLL